MRLLPAPILLICATALLSAPLSTSDALAAPSGWSTIDLPPWPGSSFEQRLQAHTAEARRHQHHHDNEPGSLPSSAGWTAADFSKLYVPKWTLEHQDITIEVDPKKKRIHAQIDALIRPTGEAEINKLPFRTDLIDLATLKVQNAEGGDLDYKYTVQSKIVGRLVVELPAPLTVGIDTKLSISYEAALDCDSKKTMLKSCSFDSQFQSVMFFRYYLSHGEAAHAPFRSDLHVVTHKGYMAAAPGVPSGPDTLQNGRLLWHFKQVERTENGGFVIAKYSPKGDPVPAEPSPDDPFVRVYTIGNYVANAPTIVDMAKEMLAFYGTHYVPFPWSGINIVQNANSLGGGYAPLSGVFMLRNVFGAKKGSGYWNTTNELLAHELAHQWWGNLARPHGSGDVSLSEAMAEVSSCLWTEKRLGTRRQIVGDNLSYMYNVPASVDMPLASPYVYGSPRYVQIVYHKGAVVFDMLRIELGEQGFLDGISHYAKAFDRDYASIVDMQAALEAATGRDLGWYFKQWFLSKGAIHVQLAGRVEPLSAGKWRFRLRTATLGYSAMRFKLPLRVYFVDGSEEDVFMDVIPEPGSSIAVAEIEFDKQPRAVRPDLGRRLLRRFSILTPGDVDLNGLVDGSDLVEAAFRKGRAVVAKNHKGNPFFYPNQGWDELFDVAQDDGHVVDEKDLDVIVDNIGTEAVSF